MAENTGKSGTKEIKTKWPVVKGLEADQKHDGKKTRLEAKEGSYIPQRKKIGLGY